MFRVHIVSPWRHELMTNFDGSIRLFSTFNEVIKAIDACKQPYERVYYNSPTSVNPNLILLDVKPRFDRYFSFCRSIHADYERIRYEVEEVDESQI